MGIKDTLYTEKGKIVTGILAAVLITTLIIVPVSIFSDRAINGKESYKDAVYTYGYDESITSTGKRQDDWMGITNDPVYGMEGTLISNDNNYMPVDTPEQMIDGVKDTDGIGYLSNTNVSNNPELDALSIPLVTINGKTIWIEPTDANYIHAPLNIVMKVPAYVAEVLKNHMFVGANSSHSPLSISDLNATQDLQYGAEGDDSTLIKKENADYGNFLIDNTLQTDFALSFILFNYIIYSNSAHEDLAKVNLNSPYSGISDEYNRGDSEFGDWIRITFGEDEWGVMNATGTVDILVDGTGTDEYALNLLMNSFSSKSEAFGLSPDLVLVQKLEDNGSYTAWETTNKDDLPPGVIFNPDEYDSTQNGRQGAFLGTQSRGIKQNKKDFIDISYPQEQPDGEISYWGYKEKEFNDWIPDLSIDSSKLTEDNFVYNDKYVSLFQLSELPLAATMATDNIVFFTTTDLMVMNYETGLMEHPQGLTKEGYKAAYENGVTWDMLSRTDQIYWG